VTLARIAQETGGEMYKAGTACHRKDIPEQEQ
jgi:hypothetical protein